MVVATCLIESLGCHNHGFRSRARAAGPPPPLPPSRRGGRPGAGGIGRAASGAGGKTVTCSSMELQTAEADVVVAGSGAAGMTAALTAAHLGLSVLVIEKTGFFGGSTARSGGGIWAPGNTVLRDAGITDTPERARAYLAYVASGVPAALREALIEHGPDMLGLVLAATPLRLAWVPGYADYYPEAPGGLPSGRSIEPVPFNGSVLGGELARLNRPYLPVPRGVAVTQADYRWLTLGLRHPRAILASARVAGRLA